VLFVVAPFNDCFGLQRYGFQFKIQDSKFKISFLSRKLTKKINTLRGSSAVRPPLSSLERFDTQLFFFAFDLIQVRWLGGRATFVARATELDDFS
jgi:hypothetical protein